MAHNGWRKPTPELSLAEEHAQAGERLSIPRNRAMLAIKKVATELGLKPADKVLLDCFSGFTKEQDWEQGRRPIVWASNEYLMQHTGFSLTTLRRHVRHLVNLRLIAFKESANGKRRGHRDDQGYITMAYGFDLAPLAARTEEFEHLYKRIQEDRKLCQSLKHQITIVRRVIRAKLDTAEEKGLVGPWTKLTESFELLLERLPKRKDSIETLLDTMDWFANFKLKVEEAFENAFKASRSEPETVDQIALDSVSNDNNMAPTGASNGTHILSTNQSDPVPSNINEERKARQDRTKTLPTVEEESPEEDIIWDIGGSRKMKTEVEISTVMAACPNFAEIVRDLGGGYLRDWNDFHRVAGQIRPMVGISEDAWNKAQQILSPLVAAAAIALVYDKHTTGEVNSPGGYLRGMCEKAKAGELHLERSFYGRMSENRAVH